MNQHCDSNSCSHTDDNHLSLTVRDSADMMSDCNLSTVILYMQACVSTEFVAD